MVIFFSAQISSAQAKDGPVIHIAQTVRNYSVVFEGKELSHSFEVFNRGTLDLKIMKVTRS